MRLYSAAVAIFALARLVRPTLPLPVLYAAIPVTPAAATVSRRDLERWMGPLLR
jgi:hypothetical protein